MTDLRGHVRSRTLGRRAFLSGSASAIAWLTGCGDRDLIAPHVTPGSPRLSARPRLSYAFALAAGLHRLDIGGVDVVLYLPASAIGRGRVPVLTYLHGASRTVEAVVEAHRAAADEAGVMIVAPYALVDSWDAVLSGLYDRDIAALDVVLQWVFRKVPADPSAIALTGFSDGATYALGVGRGNGDLFSHLVAYSPHDLLATRPVGLPRVTVAHGTADQVVPWGVSAQYIVPALRTAGHEVEFVSFDAGHAIPLQLVQEIVLGLRAGQGSAISVM